MSEPLTPIERWVVRRLTQVWEDEGFFPPAQPTIGVEQRPAYLYDHRGMEVQRRIGFVPPSPRPKNST